MNLSEENARSYIDDIRWVELLRFLTWRGDVCAAWSGAYQPATRSDDADLVTLAKFSRDHYLYYRRLIQDHLEETCERALDLGCGTGQRTNLLSRYCGQVYGIDVEPLKVGAAHHLNPGKGNVTYVLADIMTQPTGFIGEFDRVFCVDMLEHIALDTQVAFLRRAMDLLRPGGKLLLTTPRDKKVERKFPHIGLWDEETAALMTEQFKAHMEYYNVGNLRGGGEDPRAPVETATHYVMVVTK